MTATIRTVELHLSPEFYGALADDNVGYVDPRLCAAIGYLSIWGSGSRFPRVRIAGDRHGELTASYFDPGGNCGYVIGAVPDDNWNYTFHS